MSMFGAMDIGRTGVGFAHYWMDTIAHNLANVNTRTATDEEPFRAKFVVARPNPAGPFAENGSGVHVADLLEADDEPALFYDPGHPLADEDGVVQAALVDMAGQMTDLMIANRAYQVNLKTVESAKEAYQSALRIGQR